MKETSKELLLAEYDRLKTLEQNRMEIYEHSQQFYLTSITAATGIVIYLLGSNPLPSSLQFRILPVLGLLLLLGEVTYLRLVGEDIELLEISKRYQLIRDKFIKEDAGLADSFPKILVQSVERFHSWSSFRGIMGRAVSVSGVKTTVVVLNCVMAVAILIIILLPRTLWLAFVAGVSITIFMALAHVFYAAWRYKNVSKQLSKGVISWWM